MKTEPFLELPRDERTELIYETTCFGEPIEPESARDVSEGVRRALELEAEPAFLEGLSERLRVLGIPCTPQDTELMLMEVKRRFREILGKPCPRTVQEWVRGTTPGMVNRLNHYDLCFALEMDLRETAVFFQKHFLSLPFNPKSSIDAVFLYALAHHKPYQRVKELLERAESFVPHEHAHTATSEILGNILRTDDDEAFLRYLSAHCYGNEQQFQTARREILRETAFVKETILRNYPERVLSPDRLNSLTVTELLGIRYQNAPRVKDRPLPKRFTESLPNDVTLGRILNGERASYDLLRKTLMLLKFYHFYAEAENEDDYAVGGNLMDFYEELNDTLISCGFAQIYLRHPFDCLLFYCANSRDPIDTLYLLVSYEN